MIVALHSILKPGAAAAYEARHASIPEELVEVFGRIGIHDWSIWRSGVHLFHLVRCDDWQAANDVLMSDPANAAWQRDIGRFVEHFVQVAGPGPAGQQLPQVWNLEAQQGRRTE